MKGNSIFSLMVGLAVLGAGSESVLAQTTIAVPAIKFCVDSGINVSRGDSLQFSASGQGSYGYEGSPVNSTPLTNPDGDRFVNGVNIGKKDDPNAIYQGFIGGLVGKVGTNGNYFFIGSNNQLSMGQSGRLFLCYNDVANSFNNNTGGYRVSIDRISEPNPQNTAGRSPSASQQTQTGRSPQVAQNVNQFNRFEIGKLSTGEKVLRVPKQYMQQTPFREALQRNIRPSSAREYTMRNDDYGVFLWDGKRLLFTSYTVYKITDFQVGGKTYWLTETSDITGFGDLEISKPYFLESKIAFSGKLGYISKVVRDRNNSATLIITVAEGNGWNLPITHYSLDLSNPSIPVLSRLVILQKKGILQDGDPINSSDGSLYNSYTFQGYAGQSITINLEARSFSSYLVLIAPDGKKIADNHGTQRNPFVEITVTLPSTGAYKVVVNGRDRTHPQGRYILNVNSNQMIATGRSPSPNQQNTTGRSPSSNQQNPQRQTQINGDDTIVYNNIVCSGKTRNFLGQESPASCRSKEADSRLIFNSITWERQADSSIKVEMKVFNKGSAEALIEIYDSKNRLVDLKIIDGNKPPTGLMDSGIDMFTRFPISLFNQYPLTDSRKNLNEQEFSDNKKNSIIIPSGGSLKITKSSNQAFRYNAALLSLELALLGLGDPKFAEDETVKQFVKRFAQEAYFSRTSKATINLFKSEPSTQAMFRMDVVDPKKAAELLQQFVQYTVTIESDPSKNPFIGAFLDVYKDVGNIGLEIALDKFILPGLGTFAKNTRIAGSTLNTFARAADLYYATAAGEKATITLEDADKLRN